MASIRHGPAESKLKLCRRRNIQTELDAAARLTANLMPSLNLVISKIGPESDALLRNLFEHYCYDNARKSAGGTSATGR